MDYKSGSHAVWNCKYHLVWITKYRYPVLQGEVGKRAREISQPENDELRRGDQSGSRAHAHRDTTASVGIEGGTVSEGEELASDALGVSGPCASATGASSCGVRAIGWQPAATSRMKCGRNTSKIINRRCPMTTSRSCKAVGPEADAHRLEP